MSGYRDAPLARDEETPDEAASRTALTKFLLERETFLWLGRPRRNMVLSRVMIVASLLFAAAGIALYVRLDRPYAPWQLVLIVLPFFFPAPYFFLRRRFDERKRNGLFYAITDRRVLILDRTADYPLTTFDVAKLPALKLSATGDHGTIYLDPRSIPQLDPETGTTRIMDALAPPPLFDIPDAATVYRRLRSAQVREDEAIP